jgi:GNAT superfamily N-acetyltransferase
VLVKAGVPPRKRKSYWLGCFPRQFESELTVDDANCFGADLQDTEPTTDARLKDLGAQQATCCFVSIARIGVAGSAATTVRRKVQALLRTAQGESWRATNYDYVAFVWEGTRRRSDPAGFALFSITVSRAKSRRISEVGFLYDLAFVTPAKRRRGLGQFLTAGMCMWLRGCNLSGPRVVRTGVIVDVAAEVYSTGGERLGRMILDEFRYMQELRRENLESEDRLGWNIREVNDDLEA